jgi:hypothetical protein
MSAAAASASGGSDANHLSVNLVDLSIEEGVENEKCVVAQYRTTAEQRVTFQNHLKSCSRTKIPIEWVIDIADESNGWFYGTAYDFDDTTQMLHVMVPDKLNPSFDGSVILDHRTVHLIECVDGVSDALFNKVIRDSIVKVKWDVEWFEETGDGDASNNKNTPSEQHNVQGKWVASSARYYIRMANQLLVEDENFGQDSRGFVMLTADLNVKLLQCNKGRGQEDFNRLVIENITHSTPEAMDSVREFLRAQEQFGSEKSSPLQRHGSDLNSRDTRDREGRRSGAEEVPSIRKLSDISGQLRDLVGEVLDAKLKTKKQDVKIAKQFHAFTMDGDLDAGLTVMSTMEELLARVKRENEDDDNRDEELDLYEDALSLSKRLEKGLNKVLRAGDANGSGGAVDDIETLRRAHKKMQSELREKDRELEALRQKTDRR